MLEISDSCIDWKLCVICQKKTSEDLRCPIHNISDVYSAFYNVDEFRKLENLPVKINFGNQGTVQNFVDNKAAWHKQCHQKFNISKLKRMQLKNASESVDYDDTICYATRASVASLLQNVKIFDDDSKSEHLHDFTTFNSEVSVNVMATQMNLLGKLAGGDLVALEAKYHFTCLTKYRNQYRSHIRSDTS